jgi:hypothetical protein
MKTLLGVALTLFVLAVWFAAPGCSHLQPIADDAKSCAGDAYNEVRQEILPKTNAALACVLSDPSDTPQCVLEGVEALAAEYGWSFVTCALESIAGGKLAPPSDNEAAVKQRRAKAVLERRKSATAGVTTTDAATIYVSGPPVELVGGAAELCFVYSTYPPHAVCRDFGRRVLAAMPALAYGWK